MKEIRMAGTIKINFTHPMQMHMKNISNKLNDLVVAINSSKKRRIQHKSRFQQIRTRRLNRKECVVMESVQPKYVPISTLAKIWGRGKCISIEE